jgi:flagellar biosynthesis/type III secretory pathway chaperone
MEHATATREIVQRVDDTLSQIKGLKNELAKHLYAVREQRERHPHSEPYTITDRNLNQLSDHFQTIREHGERLDYNTFTNAMGKVDELIQKLRTPVQFRRADILNDLHEILDGLEQTVKVKGKK